MTEKETERIQKEWKGVEQEWFQGHSHTGCWEEPASSTTINPSSQRWLCKSRPDWSHDKTADHVTGRHLWGCRWQTWCFIGKVYLTQVACCIVSSSSNFFSLFFTFSFSSRSMEVMRFNLKNNSFSNCCTVKPASPVLCVIPCQVKKKKFTFK